MHQKVFYKDSLPAKLKDVDVNNKKQVKRTFDYMIERMLFEQKLISGHDLLKKTHTEGPILSQ